jgi:hypothetical protein
MQVHGIRYSRGNRKVGADTIIVNITSAHKCPSLAAYWVNKPESERPAWAKAGKDLCQVPPGTCYAWKGENVYKDHIDKKTGKLITGCMYNRDQQTKIWDDPDITVDVFVRALEAIIAKENRSRAKDVVDANGQPIPIRFIRFQESGDFRNQADIAKMSQIARKLSVPSYTYTARKDLNFEGLSSQLLVNGSGFKLPGISNSFQVVDKAGYVSCPRNLHPGLFDCNACEMPCKTPRCRGIKRGGCMGCSLCKTGGGKTIRELLQGASAKSLRDLKALRGDEHGGVGLGENDASEVLELSSTGIPAPGIVGQGISAPKRKTVRQIPVRTPTSLGGLL